VPAPTLTDRVRTALLALSRAKKFNQSKVAAELGINPSAISKMLNDDSRGMTLRFVEVVARAAGVPLAELVADPGSAIKELNATEAALLRALRRWPDTVTRALCAFVVFFADEPPAALQARNLHEHWRHLHQPDRDVLEAYALLLRRKALGPEQRARLLDQVSEDAEAARGLPTAEPERDGKTTRRS
jgi:transcriptional regulator with XRE-family HTH domain